MVATTAETPSTPISERILVIDDEEADLRHWSAILDNLHGKYTVVQAQDSKSGLGIFRSQKIDCVLLDLDIPDSGFSTLMQLVPDPKHPTVAVIILTRLLHPALRQIALAQGAEGWLVKQHTSGKELDVAIQKAIDSVKHLSAA